ncbi:MAG: STT3 domain-containing protein [Chloroflexota bacterium]
MKFALTRPSPWLTVLGLLAAAALMVYIRSEPWQDGYPYILGFDPYYWFHIAKQILETGTHPTVDPLINYPEGARPSSALVLPYYLAYSYHLVEWTGMEFYRWCFFAPIIPLLIAMVFAYLCGKTLSNRLGGVAAAVTVALVPAAVRRTVIGFTDTDSLVLLFSFATIYAFLKMAKASDLRRKAIYAFLTGLGLFLFKMSWVGFWYMFMLVLGVWLVYIIVRAILARDATEVKELALSFILILTGFFTFNSIVSHDFIVLPVSLVLSAWVFQQAYGYKIHVPQLAQDVVTGVLSLVFLGFVFQDIAAIMLPGQARNVLASVFQAAAPVMSPAETAEVVREGGEVIGSIPSPTVGTSISELQKVSFGELWSRLSVPLIAGFVGWAATLFKKTDEGSVRLDDRPVAGVFFALFLAGTFLMVVAGGVRFTLLCSIPLALLTGVFLGKGYDVLKERRGMLRSFALVGLALVVISAAVYLEADDQNSGQRYMTTSWWQALNWISEETPRDAVAFTWWDWGYPIEAVGERATVSDGGHGKSARKLLKTGTVFFTADEKVARDEIYGFDSVEDAEKVRQYSSDPRLKQYELEREMEPLIEEGDEAYMVVGEYLLDIYHWISYFGSWDYEGGSSQQRGYLTWGFQDVRKVEQGGVEIRYVTRASDEARQFYPISLFRDEEGRYRAFAVHDEENLEPLTATIFEKEGTHYTNMEEDGRSGAVYLSEHTFSVRSPEGEVITGIPRYLVFVPTDSAPRMLTSLQMLNGSGLDYFQKVQEFGDVKIYKVLRKPEAENEGLKVVE